MTGTMQYKRVDFARLSAWEGLAHQDQSPVYLERWAALYNLTRTIPNDRRFNMGTFGDRADTPCGTAACMAGHAMVNSWFHDRGLTLGVDSDYASLQFDQPEWFGLGDSSPDAPNLRWDRSPFDPYWVRRVVPRIALDRLTPSLMSEVAMCWMLLYWPEDLILAAVESTKDVRYSAADVHRLTPWKGKKPGVPIPREQEVKTS